MAKTAAEILVDRLIEWGVDTIFGLPGDGINGIMEALRQRQERVRFIQVRHEESAAFMACGYAKFTGRLGVCLATSGPGGIHLLNGLYDAKLDGQPVLAITGLAYHDLINTHTQQDVELDKLFIDVCVYNNRIMGPAHVVSTVDLACRTALAYRGVSHITIPSDIQDIKHDERSKRNVPHHSAEIFSKSARLPNEADVQRAAEILNKGKKVVILAGQGALQATDELEEAAELLAAPIVKPLLGKACVPDESPYTTGGIGLLGTRPSQEVLENCDTLLIVGTSFPYIEFYPKPGEVKAIQIDLDPKRIGLRYPIDIGLIGDSARSLAEINKLLKRKSDRGFLQKAQKAMKEWNKMMQEQGTVKEQPMRPQVIAHELGKRLPSNAIVTCDSGTITTWWARHIPAKRGQMHSCSGNLASMACGLPYAIGAAAAHPDRPVFAFVGDGGFSMLMADFVTAVKYQLPVRVVVIKNNTLGQIKWEQMVFLGNPEYGVDLHPIDFAAFARACGGAGFTIEDPKRCGGTLDEALKIDGPVLIEAVVDPFTAPMPAKIKAEQAAKFAESLLRGEPNRGKIAWENIVEDRVRELV
ncbi:MAG TPA: thiamine pyrophosphate-dependent enzyme [Terriglobales bacterium]|jgi:pyruvate dehydrogenase (quinone)|nr:thiamine pyrophosphate-dependent enzyme [Terriglobales bacterium]